MVGPKSKDVKYSVAFPMITPHTRPRRIQPRMRYLGGSHLAPLPDVALIGGIVPAERGAESCAGPPIIHAIPRSQRPGPLLAVADDLSRDIILDFRKEHHADRDLDGEILR